MSGSRTMSLPVLSYIVGLFLFLGPVATDSFLPAISAIAGDLGADVRAVEISLPAMFVGSAIGHLIYGPMSDRFGRRPFMVGAALLWTVAAIGSGFSNTVETLILWRFLQGLTIAAGRIVGTAAARDVFEREPLRRLLSYTLMINMAAPVVSAPIGGLLLNGFGWRSIFAYQSAAGGLCFFSCLFLFSETLRAKDLGALRPAKLARNYGGIFFNLAFLRYALVTGLIIGGVMTFLTSSPAIVIGKFGVSPIAYGFQFSALMVVTIVATAVVARTNKLISLTAMIVIGGALAAVGGLAMAVGAHLGFDNAAAIMVPMSIFVAAFGVTMPQAVAGAMQPFPQMAGAASSVLGFTQYAVGAAIASTVSRLADGTQMPMATAIAACGVATLIFAIMIRRAGTGEPAEETN